MTAEKIAIAQIASIGGDLARNLEAHVSALTTAHEKGVSLVVFPELSLTGYEPDLAAGLAMRPDDARLRVLLDLARTYEISAVVGAPLQSGEARPYLGAIIFSANGAVSVYHKIHLGGDEPFYFEKGQSPKVLRSAEHQIGLAICADTSESAHPEHCIALGADVYAAGVFLTRQWYEADATRLQSYAKKYGVLTLMANHGVSIGNLDSCGKSAAWGANGKLLGQVPGTESALLIACKCDGEWKVECVSL